MFKAALIVFLSLTSGALAAQGAEATKAVVYKSPTCGCCGKWEKHLGDNGFKVESHPTGDMDSFKNKENIPPNVRSCHTAKIGGYLVEGHVPADSIKKLLKEKPKGVVGIAVPGMPIGSPGMEGPNPEHYDVVTFDAQGNTKVFDHK